MAKLPTEKTILRSVYMSLTLKKTIENMAKLERRSFNQMTIMLLEKGIECYNQKQISTLEESSGIETQFKKKSSGR